MLSNFRAEILATQLQEMLHESLEPVTPFAMVKLIVAKLAAQKIAARNTAFALLRQILIIGFYFSCSNCCSNV